MTFATYQDLLDAAAARGLRMTVRNAVAKAAEMLYKAEHNGRYHSRGLAKREVEFEQTFLGLVNENMTFDRTPAQVADLVLNCHEYTHVAWAVALKLKEAA